VVSGRLAQGHTAYELLVAAGAPELPLGFAYRIKQEKHSDHVVRVEVRKDAERVGTECLAWSTFSLREDDAVVVATVRAASEAFAEAFPNGVPA
jgi:hypothetical protein